MAHFAQLDENDVVIQVISVADRVMLNERGDPDEAVGAAFCRFLHGQDTVWVQTSFNTRAGQHLQGGTPFRKNYAGVGYTYDRVRDAFVPPMPDVEGVQCAFNEETCQWDVLNRRSPRRVRIGVTRV